MNRPIPNCYWVEPGRLLAGEYPGHTDPEAAHAKVGALLQAGVTYFLDLTTEGELHPYTPYLGKATHARLSIPDMGVPTRAHMQAIQTTLENALAAGQVVYVHCWGGVGRTGTVVGCYLVEHGYGGEAALEELTRRWSVMEKAAHRQTPETDTQRAFVRHWRKDK